MPDYNGWSNRATWNTSLWLNNDEPLYRAKQAVIQGLTDKDEVAKTLKKFCYATWPGCVTPDGCPLSQVNWIEIAEAEIES